MLIAGLFIGDIMEVGAPVFPDGEQRAALWLKLGKRPNPGCSRCHGRGYTGRNVTTGKYILCRCVKTRPTKELE